MYNRYVPQPDGSFRRNPMAEPGPPPCQAQQPCQTQQPNRQQSPSCEPEPQPSQQNRSCGAPPPCGSRPPRRPVPHSRPEGNPGRGRGIGDFFRNLLPKGLDTEDLLIVLLLLLMAGDCQEDQNRALLTLALYLFL